MIEPGDAGEYVAHLDAYVEEQKEAWAIRAANEQQRVHDVMEWMAYHDVVADDAGVLVALSFLFLVVSILSTVALLLTKLVGRKGEASLRRALGASRQALFGQQLTEVGAIGFAGGVIGLGSDLVRHTGHRCAVRADSRARTP